MELEKDDLQSESDSETEVSENPEPENPEEAYLKECLKEFLGFYPEFKSLFVKVELVEKEPENNESESKNEDNNDSQDEDLQNPENQEGLNVLSDDDSQNEPSEKPKPELVEVESVNEIMVKNWESVFKRVTCLYPEFRDAKKCQKVPLYALVAHYFVYQGFASSIGILSQKGLVASSSVGDVSVSYQASPYAAKGNDFSYFLSLTPYGMEYLAWLQRQAGLLYVN